MTLAPLRERVRSREPVLGTFVQLGDPTSLEVLGRAGFDFAIVDFEHGGVGFDAVPPLVRAADAVGLPLLVRLRLEELARCSQMLDLGVCGLHVPRITDPGQARDAVLAARYPPLGERGACPGIRASEYGWREWPEHQARAEERTIVGVGLEGGAGIEAAGGVSAIAGVDYVFVGVFDLAASLGHPGEVEHPQVVDALREITARANSAGVAVGTWAPDLDVARRWRSLGVTVITVATDVLLWRRACVELVDAWRADQRSPASSSAMSITMSS